MSNSKQRATGVSVSVFELIQIGVKLGCEVGAMFSNSNERRDLIQQATEPYRNEIKQLRIVENSLNIATLIKKVWSVNPFQDDDDLFESYRKHISNFVENMNPLILELLMDGLDELRAIDVQIERFLDQPSVQIGSALKEFIKMITPLIVRFNEKLVSLLENQHDLLKSMEGLALLQFLFPQLMKFMENFVANMECLRQFGPAFLTRSKAEHIAQLRELRRTLNNLGMAKLRRFDDSRCRSEVVAVFNFFKKLKGFDKLNQVQIDYKFKDAYPLNQNVAWVCEKIGLHLQTGYGKMPINKILAKGKMIIINHEKYAATTGYHKRNSHDVTKLKTTFEKLDMEVEVKQNLNYEEVLQFMAEVKQFSFSHFTSLVIAVLGHGHQNEEIVACDGKRYNLKNISVALSSNPTLNGKLKFFIVQSCKGELEVDAQDEESIRDNGLPADTITLYSTAEGYTSFLLHNGSVFIDELTKRINSHPNHNIPDIAQFVSKEVRKESESWRNSEQLGKLRVSQIPFYSGTLTQ